MSEPAATSVVIGLGNLLMADDGIGVHVVQHLAAGAEAGRGVDYIDAAGRLTSVLHWMQGKARAIFVDCAMQGTEPGTICRYSPEEAASKKVLFRLSLHEGDLLETLDLSRRLGLCSAEVLIFGIEPEYVGCGMDLSDRLRGRLDEYVAAVSQASR